MYFIQLATRCRLLAAGGLCLLAIGGSHAQENPKLPVPKVAPFPAPAPGKETTFASQPHAIHRYTLGEALAIAHARHPQLDALRASMNAALLKGRGLGEVNRLIGFLSPDMDSREKQSSLGLKAAMAEYDQAQHEVTYAVIRCYFTIVYAREQTKVARDLVDQLDGNLEYVRRIVEGKDGVKGINANTLSTLQVAVGTAREKLVQAETGAEMGREALREAMGLEPLARVDAADEVLPEITADKMTRDVVIAHAVTRRGEVQLSEIGAEVSRLEVCAQWSRRMNLMATTYANAADIHARPIPGPMREPDYKPGMIGPEMPDRLVGNRSTRVATAEQYAVRSRAAAAQARSLVGLEAAVGYARWEESTRSIKIAKEAAKAGRTLIDRLREAAGAAISKEETIQAEVSSTLAFAALNKAKYDRIVALANLERITAGGVRVNFPGR